MRGPSVAALLQDAIAVLEGASPTARLDAEILLCGIIGRERTWLRTFPEALVDEDKAQQFQALVARRRAGEPVAYLTGKRGFWTLDLAVGPQTLIPRPDTELLVEAALALGGTAPGLQVLDLGTGSGAIALALAAERPGWQVTAVDFSPGALAMAEANAESHDLKNVRFLQSNWFEAVAGQQFGLIVSNPPYIAANDPHLSAGDLRFEPLTALVSGEDGLNDIRRIVAQAPAYLATPGWLAFEHGYDQGEACRQLLAEQGFAEVETRRDLGDQERVTLGRWPC